MLSDRELFAAHMSYRLAQVVAVGVRQAATQEDWVAETALPHSGKIVDVIMPIMGQNTRYAGKSRPVDILSAQRIEPEPDAQTITASPANVILTVMPSVYDDISMTGRRRYRRSCSMCIFRVNRLWRIGSVA